ncbi:MAG: NADH-quinone oxidoreductase subunit NuoE [Candidatus Thermoplasmatota archaeon]|nr:NADH-quinone oxidoreductase subunit NuoE [Candidatus Thermoplasmatota archaeon]MBS3801285.1 NADH-quinone oxidoreductase subunit NuoE [Candidatus Thermoplasmatota archaeon]
MTLDLSKAKKLIESYSGKKGILIPLLQDIQKEYGFVPNEVVKLIAKAFDMYPSKIYGVLTFYTQFYTTPRGKHTIKVCQGTACHVMGGKALLDYISDKLEIDDGETTHDGLFSLERVACLGCCGMAPVIMVDKEFYGGCDFKRIDQILQRYKEKEDN